MYTSLLLTLLAASSLVAAGPHDDRLARHGRGHNNKIRVVHRRHHARANANCDAVPANNATTGTGVKPTPAQPSTGSSLPGNGGVLLAPATGGCTDGAFQCVGMIFQQCAHGSWQTLSTCSGDNIVCSSDPAATGCVWSWSVPSTTPSAPATGSPSPAANNGPAPSSAVPSVSTPSAVPSAAVPDPYDDGEEDCEDEDEDNGPGAPLNASSTIINNDLSARPTNMSVNPNMSGNKTQNATITSLKLNPTVVTTTVDVQPTFATNGSMVNATRTLTTSVMVPSVTPSINATVPVGNKPTFSAPHYVIYSDYWLFKMPSVSELRDFNRFILAFWMSNSGPVDNAQAWAWFSADYRKQVIADYHKAGIALMVSAFGSTDAPTSWGYDPIKTAQQLAAYVVQYGLDGVDIDYEDMDAMNSNKAEAWLIPFQIELRRLLPAPYIISHAPVAPWFTSLNVYQSGAYVNIHKQVGSTIDFYNIQFYNQGDGVYTDCNTLLFSSGGWWPSTSVFEIHSYTGVPLNNIVIGKPLTPGMAANGYMDGLSLNKCVAQAQAKGWNGGVMFWEWVSSTAPMMMATTRGLSA